MMRLHSNIGFISLLSFCFLVGFSQFNLQENTAPEIKFTAPKDKSIFQWNSIVPYTITVSDREDGNSDYDEINPNEVMLVVKYLNDSAQVKKYLLNESNTDYEPLLWMGTSTCFSCHKAKGKLIGPSFDLISDKYQGNPKAIEVVANNIITGSTSTWGDAIMPPHPDLKLEKAKEIVRWILKHNTDPDKNYLTGIEGAFKTKALVNSEKGVYVLTASYTDHGINDIPQSCKQGQQTIILKSY